jgi:hypothetical protein
MGSEVYQGEGKSAGQGRRGEDEGGVHGKDVAGWSRGQTAHFFAPFWGT